MTNPIIYSLIKTECGRSKYNDLASKKGFLARIRLYWFVIFATFKDWNIRNHGSSS